MNPGRRVAALRIADPPAWAGRVRAAMTAHQGRVAHAAAELGVSWRTLMRWLAEPALADVPRHPAGVSYGPRRRPLETA